jgi:hypothetical protein
VRLTGTLHVSLPTDIIQLFGTSSVPAIVAGSVLGVFELGERFASQRAKDALSKWLLTFDVQKARALPDGTQELFERIFGERHFSLKCFIRSAAFSLGAMAFIGILCLLISPRAILIQATEISDSDTFWLLIGLLALWLPWSILIDYVSLFKTRVILRVLLRTQLQSLALAMLVIDSFVYSLIFHVGIVVIVMIDAALLSQGVASAQAVSLLQLFVFGSRVPTISHPLNFILFWAGFAPSIWMWLYVAALFVTRTLLKSEKLVNWFRWALDVEKNPFRSIGAVAATLAFIASVAIILVSAEVSRISAAS